MSLSRFESGGSGCITTGNQVFALSRHRPSSHPFAECAVAAACKLADSCRHSSAISGFFSRFRKCFELFGAFEGPHHSYIRRDQDIQIWIIRAHVNRHAWFRLVAQSCLKNTPNTSEIKPVCLLFQILYVLNQLESFYHYIYMCLFRAPSKPGV